MSNDSAGGFAEEEHPSDALLSIFAATLPELFATAGRACFALMTDVEDVRPIVARRFQCEALDVEELLVAWLNELIGVASIERLLFSEFTIEALSETHLRAFARGEGVDPSRHTLRREVKAATYHRLSVRAGRDGWSASVLFDI